MSTNKGLFSVDFLFQAAPPDLHKMENTGEKRPKDETAPTNSNSAFRENRKALAVPQQTDSLRKAMETANQGWYLPKV
jgi:hypothetical protein